MNLKSHPWIVNIALFVILVGMVVIGVRRYKIGTYPVKVEEIRPASEVKPRLETLIEPRKVPLEYERLLKKEYPPRPTPKDLKEAYQAYEEEDVGKNIFGEKMKEERTTRLKEIDKVIVNCEQGLKDDPDNKQIQNRLKTFQLLKSVISGELDKAPTKRK